MLKSEEEIVAPTIHKQESVNTLNLPEIPIVARVTKPKKAFTYLKKGLGFISSSKTARKGSDEKQN